MDKFLSSGRILRTVRPVEAVVIHSFLEWVKPRAEARSAVQVFDPAGVFCSNSGFPESGRLATESGRDAGEEPAFAPINQSLKTMKRTYQPSKIRRARTHGFLVRMKSRGGRAVINARRAKGRKKLSQV